MIKNKKKYVDEKNLHHQEDGRDVLICWLDNPNIELKITGVYQ